MSVQKQQLSILDCANRMLAGASSLEEIKDVRDKAEAVRRYAQSAAMGLQLQNCAAELKLRAERKAGELLRSLTLRGGNRRPNSHSARLKLADLGINHSQSARWQLEASIPEDVFRDYVSSANDIAAEITTRGLLRLAQNSLVGRSHTKARNGQDRFRADANGRPAVAGIAHPPTRKSATAGPDLLVRELRDSNVAFELIEELANHRSLLTEILAPACEDPPRTLQRVDKRTILRILTEMNDLLMRLKSIHAIC